MHTTRKIFRAYLTSQATQWTKEKLQKDSQRSTKHTYKAKDRVTRTPLKHGGESMCSGRVGSSSSKRLSVCMYRQVWGEVLRIRLFRIISIPSKTLNFRLPNHVILMNVRHWTYAVNVHNENSNWYKCRFNLPQ